jgi:hypothetical protein
LIDAIFLSAKREKKPEIVFLKVYSKKKVAKVDNSVALFLIWFIALTLVASVIVMFCGLL